MQENKDKNNPAQVKEKLVFNGFSEPVQQPEDSTEIVSEKASVISEASRLLPADNRAREVLRRRAKNLAAEISDKNQISGQSHLLCQSGPNEMCGIPYRWLDEVISGSCVVSVPGSPEYIAGVIAHQGELLSVFNTRYFFHIHERNKCKEQWIVIVKASGLRTGLLVDSVIGTEEYKPADLEPPIISQEAAEFNYFSGIAKGRITILDVEKMLSSPELTVNSGNK